jgi:hypothetical protein
MNNTGTHPNFTDLLKDEHFVAIYRDWEYHTSIEHPAAEMLYEYMVEEFNYEA